MDDRSQSNTGTSTSSSEPPHEYFIVKSSDGTKFDLWTVAVSFSGVLQKLLEEKKKKIGDDVAEVRTPLERHNDSTVRSVYKYLELRADKKAPEELFRDTNPTIGKLLSLLLIAHELQIPCMVEAVSEKIASKMETKSVEWVRDAFRVEGSIAEADAAEIRGLYPWAFDGVDDQELKPEDED